MSDSFYRLQGPEPGHVELAFKRFQGANQHSGALAGRLCDDVQTVASMDGVHVQRPRLKIHGCVFLSRTTMTVTGRVSLSQVGLNFNYNTAQHLAILQTARQCGAQEIASHYPRRAMKEFRLQTLPFQQISS